MAAAAVFDLASSPTPFASAPLQSGQLPLTNSAVNLWQARLVGTPVRYAVAESWWQGIEQAERINAHQMKQYRDRLERSGHFRAPFLRSLPASTFAQ